MKIPKTGVGADALFETLESYRSGDVDWRSGRTWAYVYDAGPEAEAVGKRAFMAYLCDNALDPTAFPSLLRFETEIVAMAIEHLNGSEDAAGTFTSGGTESIMLAIKAARDHARAHRPEITRPNIVMATTGHAAFHKSAHYLGLEVKNISVDPTSFRALPQKMAEAIDDQTVMLVGSAPSYAHGVIDPIAALGQVALDKGVLFHVDACVGGFMLKYLRELGADIEAYDFSVPGVTSMSMDFHKYAYCPKGSSIVVHAHRAMREHQIYSCANWTGYTVVNPTVQSSKSGGPLAATWATLQFIGADGYRSLARTKLDATKKVIDGINAIESLHVLGEPDMNLVAFASDDINVFHLADEMKVRGWYVQPQLRYEDSPENIHLSVNPACAKWVDDLLNDLAECVEVVRDMPSGALAGAAGDMFASMPSLDMNDEMFGQLLQMGGISGTALPARMAEINEVLNAMPPKLREQLLDKFINALYVT